MATEDADETKTVKKKADVAEENGDGDAVKKKKQKVMKKEVAGKATTNGEGVKKKKEGVVGKKRKAEDEDEEEDNDDEEKLKDEKEQKTKKTKATKGVKKKEEMEDKTKKKKKKPASGSDTGSTKDDEDDGGDGGKQKKTKVRIKSDSPWSTAWKAHPRLSAVLEGLGRIFYRAQSRGEGGTAEEREMLVECLHFVARVTADPVREQALKYADEADDRWKQSCLTRPWRSSPPPSSSNGDATTTTKAAAAAATPAELLSVLPRLYQMERVGVHPELKSQVAAHMKKQPSPQKQAAESSSSSSSTTSTTNYTAKDYLGWDPITEAPPDGILPNPKDPSRPLSRYEVLSHALRHAFYADRLGLSLGACTYHDVLQWLPKMRPYKGPGDFLQEIGGGGDGTTSHHHHHATAIYRAQCDLIITVVETLSDLGELRLPAALLPHEFLFTREHLAALIRRRDLLMVARFVMVLHIFGSDDDDDVTIAGMAYLLGTQSPIGSWEQAMNAIKADEEDTELASMLGVKALLVHSPRGYGPGIPGLIPALLTWQKADADPPDDPTILDLPPELPHMRSVTMLPSGEYDMREQRMRRVVGRLMGAMEGRKRVDVEEEEEEEEEEEVVVVVKGGGSRGGGGGGGNVINSSTVGKDVMMMEEEEGDVRERVGAMGKRLEKGREEADWRTVFETLKALKKLPGIDRKVLEDTKIGKVVGKLRKAGNEQVSALGRKIIERWKQMLEADMEATAPPPPPASAAAPSLSPAPPSSSVVTEAVAPSSSPPPVTTTTEPVPPPPFDSQAPPPPPAAAAGGDEDDADMMEMMMDIVESLGDLEGDIDVDVGGGNDDVGGQDEQHFFNW